MEIRLHLRPGQNGTKALVHKYGDRLVCVRYRYDAQTNRRHKTVELIEETVPWHPQTSRERHLMQPTANELVLVRVGYEELALREQLRRAGGRWQAADKAWSVPYGVVKHLGRSNESLEICRYG